MNPAIVFGILLGATVGFGIGYLGSRAGGTCPFMCNPYIAMALGGVVGALIASSLAPRAPAYKPSPHLLTIRTQEEFESAVLAATEPVLLEFYTPECPICRQIEPLVHALADRYAGRASVAKLNADELPEPVLRYGVEGAPTFILFKGGQPAGGLVGLVSEQQLAELIEKGLK